MRSAEALLRLLAISFSVAIFGCDGGSGDSSGDAETPNGGVVVFAPNTARPVDAIMRQFRSATGIGYSLATGDAASAMRQADVFIGDSFVELWEVAEADLLRPFDASLHERVVAGQLSDPERRFAPLAAAPRGVVYNERLLPADEVRMITGYASLADDRWKGRLCLSSSRVDGNRLLVAYLIRRVELREAEITVRRWLQNLALPEFENDGALLEAISLGDCALGILDLRLAAAGGSPPGVGIHTFADDDRWLFDIAGAGISRHAGNPDLAARVVEWLMTAEGSNAFTGQWRELPLSRDAIESRTETSMGAALEMADTLSGLGFLLEEADLLIERAGYR